MSTAIERWAELDHQAMLSVIADQREKYRIMQEKMREAYEADAPYREAVRIGRERFHSCRYYDSSEAVYGNGTLQWCTLHTGSHKGDQCGYANGKPAYFSVPNWSGCDQCATCTDWCAR